MEILPADTLRCGHRLTDLSKDTGNCRKCPARRREKVQREDEPVQFRVGVEPEVVQKERGVAWLMSMAEQRITDAEREVQRLGETSNGEHLDWNRHASASEPRAAGEPERERPWSDLSEDEKRERRRELGRRGAAKKAANRLARAQARNGAARPVAVDASPPATAEPVSAQPPPKAPLSPPPAVAPKKPKLGATHGWQTEATPIAPGEDGELIAAPPDESGGWEPIGVHDCWVLWRTKVYTKDDVECGTRAAQLWQDLLQVYVDRDAEDLATAARVIQELEAKVTALERKLGHA